MLFQLEKQYTNRGFRQNNRKNLTHDKAEKIRFDMETSAKSERITFTHNFKKISCFLALPMNVCIFFSFFFLIDRVGGNRKRL